MINNMFNSRINRVNFFLSVLLHGLIIIGVGWLITHIYSINSSNGLISYVLLPMLSFIGLLVIISLFSYIVRRLNDMEMSRWKLIFILIPIVNIFFAVYIFFTPGTDQDKTN